MATRKLYYEDTHLAVFTAQVLTCQETEKGWEITLDATAFYPEGGGQAADTGTLGDAAVLYTRESGEEVVHLCDKPLTVGSRVEGRIDWEARFYRMQQHSGEHIVSGILYRRYGCQNRGFHMGADLITIDVDHVVPAEDLPAIEAEANAAVWANVPVRCWYPSEEELGNIFYRSKKALEFPIRIVEFPGVDSCACCGTHVKLTGEVGPIKLFSSVNFRTGSRIEMACGKQAMDILNQAYDQNKLVSQAFSAQITETGAAAQRMNQLAADLKYRLIGLERQMFAAIAQSYAGTPSVLHFQEGLDGTGLRELTDAIAKVSGGQAAVFSGADGDGYGYCLALPGGDLRQLNKAMTASLNGRGGGKPHFQQGRVNATRAEIEAFFAKD